MKKNFMLTGERRRYNLTLAPELIAGLLEVPVKHFRPENPPLLINFFLASDHFPVALKFRGDGRPEAESVYKIMLEAEASKDFRDQDGGLCRSRNRLVIRVYPLNQPTKSDGELRFTVCKKEEQVEFSPVLKFLQALHGKERNGYLWVATPGVDYKINYLNQADEILFEGNVVVETMNSSERSVAWTASVMDVEAEGGRITVYDRRRWPSSILAHATHIRRTLSGDRVRAFEFITLRDANPELEAKQRLNELIAETVC